MSKKVCDFCGEEYDTDENINNEGERILIFRASGKNSLKICSECIKKCNKKIVEYNKKRNEKNNKDKLSSISPEKIKQHLDSWIIGQDYAKKIISVALYNHAKRQARIKNNPDISDKLRVEKTNIIMIGPSGSGKTEFIRALTALKELGIVCTIQTANKFTSTGYIGADVEDIARDLLIAADNDLEKAQFGVVFLDEFDKLKKSSSPNNGKDVNGAGVQETLLRMVEGTTCDIKKNKNDPNSSSIKFDTTNVLFIASGAFEGIDEIVNKRLKKETSIGFGGNVESKKKKKYNEIYDKINHDDLVEFGIIREMSGRNSVIAPFMELTEEDLKYILTEPKHALIKQYIEMLKMDKENADIVFTDEALDKIASIAKKEYKTGARALKTILEKILLDTMYELPNNDKNITKIEIDGNLKCNYVYFE